MRHSRWGRSFRVLFSRSPWRDGGTVIVVDDGSSDSTSSVAMSVGALVLRHGRNRGKGAALRSGLEHARSLGATMAVTVDADGQHLAEEAEKLALHPAPSDALILGVRNLVADGAPRANRFSNGVSNFFLSRFTGRKLNDTQCGLRRYPIAATLTLGAHDDGYAFEAECVLRAARCGWAIVEVPVRVHYPPETERVTHFHVRPGSGADRLPRRQDGRHDPSSPDARTMTARRVIGGLVAASVALGVLHVSIHLLCRIWPPSVRVSPLEVTSTGGVRRAGRASTRVVDGILEVRLAGTPEEIGVEHAALLHDEMVETERVVWRLLYQNVPNRAARLLLLDFGQAAYRNVASGMTDDRRRELAASAAVFRPDPFLDRFDTFQRFVYLSSLYDISLGYESSPLDRLHDVHVLGATPRRRAILARAISTSKLDDVFDRKKAVFLVNEDGKIPFASVAWPGLVGVVSGMNREGLAVVVHGARAGRHDDHRRAGRPRAPARPVARPDAAKRPCASWPNESAREPHRGHGRRRRSRRRVERVPGAPPFVRLLGERAAVTNHLEGPFASDPKNLRVRAIEHYARAPCPRRRARRLRSLIPSPRDAVRLLRDRAARAAPLAARRSTRHRRPHRDSRRRDGNRNPTPLGEPSAAPLGEFVAFDLETLLDPDLSPDADGPHDPRPRRSDPDERGVFAAGFPEVGSRRAA